MNFFGNNTSVVGTFSWDCHFDPQIQVLMPSEFLNFFPCIHQPNKELYVMETKNSVMLLILYTNPPFKHKIIDFVTVQDNHGHPVKVLFTYE